MDQTTNTVAENLLKAHHALMEEMEILDNVVANKPCSVATLQDLLAVVQATVEEHFHWEEEEGYLTEVSALRPHLERAIGSLRQDHQTLAQSLRELVRDVNMATRVDQNTCASVQAWLRQLRDHEARENLLVEDTFVRDEGTKD